MRILAALAGGCTLGLTLFTLSMLAFVKGHPVFDPVLERDPIHPF